jgi:hypothetical protein
MHIVAVILAMSRSSLDAGDYSTGPNTFKFRSVLLWRWSQFEAAPARRVAAG